MKAKKLLALSAIATALITGSALAKPYPAGTQLADKQEITLNNGAEEPYRTREYGRDATQRWRRHGQVHEMAR